MFPGHDVQAREPDVFLYVPATHGEHGELLGPVKPAGHTHSLEPLPDVEFPGHMRQ